MISLLIHPSMWEEMDVSIHIGREKEWYGDAKGEVTERERRDREGREMIDRGIC